MPKDKRSMNKSMYFILSLWGSARMHRRRMTYLLIFDVQSFQYCSQEYFRVAWLCRQGPDAYSSPNWHNFH